MSLPFLRLQARPGAARGKERVAAAGTGERRLTPEPFLLFAFFILAAAALFLTGCSRPVNAPRTLDEYAGNTLFSSFSGRSPRTLDPQESYSSDETLYVYGTYEMLYGYHYLKRPYELVPRAAEAVRRARRL